MPDYEIFYFNPEGGLIHSMSAACNNDAAARVVAHAMKPLSSGLLEVWKAGTLIYRRLRPVAGTGTGRGESTEIEKHGKGETR